LPTFSTLSGTTSSRIEPAIVESWRLRGSRAGRRREVEEREEVQKGEFWQL
jgi:hypothetical protein